MGENSKKNKRGCGRVLKKPLSAALLCKQAGVDGVLPPSHANITDSIITTSDTSDTARTPDDPQTCVCVCLFVCLFVCVFLYRQLTCLGSGPRYVPCKKGVP